MFIQQLYTDCLAEAAYYIESNGQAAIIDPMRDVKPYLELAAKRGATINYIFETHFHADFISGHVDLANATGATIVYGPMANADYDIIVAKDYEEFILGAIRIRVLHTPGHTMESSCFLVLNEARQEHAVFTGDTLFVGDVGRPDIGVKFYLPKESLARHLYRSIHEKLMVLDDATIVYPGHGAGSSCGKKIEPQRSSTIGAQKQSNYALLADSEDAFVKAITKDLSPPPQHFQDYIHINKTGGKPMQQVLEKANHPLTLAQFKEAMQEENVILLDSRLHQHFAKGHLPNSINIGLKGFFEVWASALIKDLNHPILLITAPDKAEETILHLARVGFENILGHLDGGFRTWKNALETVEMINNSCPIQLRGDLSQMAIIDVRSEAEYKRGHISNAQNIPLEQLESTLNQLDRNTEYFVYCQSGYRSMIATSILKKAGFTQIINVKKGYEGIINPSKTCCCSKALEASKEDIQLS